MNALTTEADIGGLPILGYQIEMEEGNAGAVNVVHESLELTVTVSTGIVKGKTYGFRYRARNSLGYGPFSTYVYILAATIPGTPK